MALHYPDIRHAPLSVDHDRELHRALNTGLLRQVRVDRRTSRMRFCCTTSPVDPNPRRRTPTVNPGLRLLRCQRLLDPLVGDRDIPRILRRGVTQVGALPDEQIHVSHGIVVLGIDLQRLFQIAQSGVEDRLRNAAVRSARTPASWIGPGPPAASPAPARALL